MICDESCKEEFQHPAGETDSLKANTSSSVNYAVVSPVGRSTVKMKDMAPRLSTLDGKTIAVVGGSFMAYITHPEIKKLILENYPTAKVLVLDEIGSAGAYPAPGINRRNKDEFQKRLQTLGVDAVISGNCGCGLCTPKELGSCIAAEYAGVPSVTIAAPGFVKEVYYTSINNTITVSSALIWGNNMAPSTTDPQKIMELIAWDIAERSQFALGSGKQYTNRTVLITEPVANNLAEVYKSQAALENDLIITSRRPLKECVFANYYANPGSNPEEKYPINHWRGHISRSENAENTAVPAWYNTDSETMMTIPSMKEGMTVFLITGDDSRNKVQTMPGGGYATVKIELPKDWNALTEKLGYEPIDNYYLKESGHQ